MKVHELDEAYSVSKDEVKAALEKAGLSTHHATKVDGEELKLFEAALFQLEKEAPATDGEPREAIELPADGKTREVDLDTGEVTEVEEEAPEDSEVTPEAPKPPPPVKKPADPKDRPVPAPFRSPFEPGLFRNEIAEADAIKLLAGRKLAWARRKGSMQIVFLTLPDGQTYTVRDE